MIPPDAGGSLFLVWTGSVAVVALALRARHLFSRWRGSRGGPAPSGDRSPEGGPADPPAPAPRRDISRTLLVALAAGLSAAGFGFAVLRMLAPGGATPAMTILLSLVLGWGIQSHLIFLLGLGGRLRSSWCVVLCAAGLLAGAVAGALPGLSMAAAAWEEPGVAGAIAAVFCLAILAVIFASCFAPPRGFDAHAYHLELPRRYAAAGAIPYIPFMAHSPWPQAVHMLFVPGFLFRCSFYAQVTSCLMGLSLLGLLFESARMAVGTDGALVACLALLMVGELVFQMADASVDMGLAVFSFASLVSFGSWLASHDTAALVLAGLLAGFAAAAKITGILLLLVLSAAGLIAGDSGSLGKAAGSVSLLLGAASMVAAPWYVRSAWLTGNPVYHFATRLFRTRRWPLSSEEAHRAVARSGGWGGVRGARLARYPLEQGLKSPTGWGAGIVGLAAVAPLFPLPATVTLIGAVSAALVAVTLVNTNQLRLMFGAAAGLSLAAGAAFSAAASGLSIAGWYPPLLVSLLGSLGLLGAVQMNRHKLTVALDPARTPEYFRRFLPYYEDFVWINRHTHVESRLLLWTTRGHLLERDYVWLPPWQQGIFDFTILRDGDQFFREMKRHSITHVYFTDYEIDRQLFRYLYDLHEEMIRRGLMVEEKRFRSGYQLFRLASLPPGGESP